jgi:HD-like signal output (HDOD) protein
MGYIVTQTKLNTRSVVEKIQKLPTLPEIALNIMDLAASPDVSMDEMAREISRDPSLAARVLKVANSPFYGMPRQVDSLKLALVILGLNEIRNLALGIMIFKMMGSLDNHPNYNRKRFWTHSVGCAMAAKILSRKLGTPSGGADFVVGLLHDMGKIVIDEYFNPEYALIYEHSQRENVPMVNAEKKLLGESHEQIAGWLAEKWRLPETLCEAVTYHHSLTDSGSVTALKDPKTAAMAYIAEAFCDHNNVGWDGDSGCNDVKAKKVWNILLSGQTRYGMNDVDEILDDVLQEFRKTPLGIF